MDDAGELGPEPSLISGAATLPGEGLGLAGVPACDEIDMGSGLTAPPVESGTDVIVLRHLRPMPRKHTSCPRVDLHLSRHREPGPLQPERQSPDTGEQLQGDGWIHGRPALFTTSTMKPPSSPRT